MTDIPRAEPAPTGLFVTDLDGTLLRSDRTFAPADMAALRRLGERGVVRVLATGRSLYSFTKVGAAAAPIDYLVFSTGAGVAEFPTGRILRAVSLDPGEVADAAGVLTSLRLDFMVQRPIPDTHAFAFCAAGGSNPDFERRIALYREFAVPLDGDHAAAFGPATQLVAIVPAAGGPDAVAEVRRRLRGLTVIRTTSPLDHCSTWIEVFPANVSKSRTTGWLAERLGVPREHTAAVGNDYNDLDLLEWAARSFVTANAAADLRSRYTAVASHDEAGVADAIERWLVSGSGGLGAVPQRIPGKQPGTAGTKGTKGRQ